MIPYIDRETKNVAYEPVWGGACLKALYHKKRGFLWLQKLAVHLLSIPFVSSLWGAFHDLTLSRRRIRPFCEEFHIDTKECELSLDRFTSFNHFFIRTLKKESRPRNEEPGSVIIPADARYSFFENVGKDTSCIIKGIEWNLEKLLGSLDLAKKFHGGTLILARLCPLDCHRFYFPFSGHALKTRLIKGPLFSVNPIATKERPWIFWTNKRTVTLIQMSGGHSYAMVEIGATNCGSIHQTFVPGQVEKGQEKGYFKLGGSSIALLFEPHTLCLEADLQTDSDLEIYCKIGQKLGGYVT